MKEIIFIMALALVSSNAMAEWVLYNATDTVKIYVAEDAIKKNGDKRMVWSIKDYTSAQINKDGNKYLSSKALLKFDCTLEEAGFKYMSDHPERLGGGAPVYHYTFEEQDIKYMPIPPNTIIDSIMKFACK